MKYPPAFSRHLLRIAGRGLALVALLYLGLLALVYFGQERLLFYPTVLPADHRFQLEDTREVSIVRPGAVLSALHFRNPNPQGLVFFLHGNAGNLESWFTDLDFYRNANYDLFMIDYRGYGKSTGSIDSEAQLHADVRAAWGAIAPTYAGKRMVIYGRSLGSGLAAKLAADVQPDLTILVSPYFSVETLGHEKFSWVPRFLSRYPLSNDQWLPQIRNKVILVHGDRDELIPFEHSEHLKRLWPTAELLRIDGAGHNDLHHFPAYLDALSSRLKALAMLASVK